MNILSLCGVCFLTAVTYLVLRSSNDNVFYLIAISITVLILSLFILSSLNSPINDFISKLHSTSLSAYSSLIVKSFAVALITDITSELLSGLGICGLSDIVEFAGKAELIILLFPFIDNFTEKLLGLL